MGVGTPEDLLDGVAAGIDMFDCVMPTRTPETVRFSRAPARSPSRTRVTRTTRDTRSKLLLHHLPDGSREPTCGTST